MTVPFAFECLFSLAQRNFHPHWNILVQLKEN